MWFEPKRVRRVRDFVRALNARDFAALSNLVRADLQFLDTMGSTIAGRESYVAAMQEVYRIVPDLRIETDDVFEQDGDMLARGRLVSSDPAFCSDSLWRVTFSGDMIAGIQAFRQNNAISVPRMTTHLRAHERAD